MIYQPSFQVVTLHLTFSSTVCEPAETQTLLCQEQSWIPDAPKGTQLVFIPTARVDNHEVTTIIEEHKLFFNPCIIALMFMQDTELHSTWDACQSVEPNTCDIDQGVCDA